MEPYEDKVSPWAMLRLDRVFFLEIVKSSQAMNQRQARFRHKLWFIPNVSSFFFGILLGV